MKSIIIFTILLASYQTANAQTQFCRTTASHINTEYPEQPIGLKSGQITIPIIFHVLHSGESIGTDRNISDAQILSALDVLNEDFNRMNEDTSDTRSMFKSVAADLEIDFCPAKYDTLGNLMPTPGIRRVSYTQADLFPPPYADFDLFLILPKIIWDPSRYYNVVIMDIPIASGIAHFPANAGLNGIGATASQDAFVATDTTDAVILNYQFVGRSPENPFAVAANYDGRVITHETGHWLGLLHVSGDFENCTMDDYCSDTPDTDRQTPAICPSATYQSCGSIDMWENYMDYTLGQCMNLFTKDQKQRILTALTNSPRRVAIQSSNVCMASAVGIDESRQRFAVSLFPNPAESTFTLEASQNVMDNSLSLFVTDIRGREVLQWTGRLSASNKFDISGLEPGVYIIQLWQKGSRETIKLIKQ